MGTASVSVGTGRALQGVKTLRTTQIRMTAGTGSPYSLRKSFVLGQHQLQKCRTREKSSQLRFLQVRARSGFRSSLPFPFP